MALTSSTMTALQQGLMQPSTTSTAPRPTENFAALYPGYLGQKLTELSQQGQAGMQSMQDAAAEARQANESRYEDILGKYNTIANTAIGQFNQVPGMYQNIADFYRGRSADTMGMLQGWGDLQRAEMGDIRSKMLGSLASRQGGLMDSVSAGLERGVESDYARNLMRVEDALNRQKLQYMTQVTGEEGRAMGLVPQSTAAMAQQAFNVGEQPLAFMERREDVGPTLEQMGQYAQSIGAGMGAAGLPLSAQRQQLQNQIALAPLQRQLNQAMTPISGYQGGGLNIQAHI